MSNTKSLAELENDVRCARPALEARVSRVEVAAEIAFYPPLTEEMWDFINLEGFRTGSSVFALGIEPADEDWCVHMPPSVFEGYAYGTQTEEYIHDSGDFTSLYAHDSEGKTINLICFKNYELYEAWREATAIMSSLKPLADQFSKKMGTRTSIQSPRRRLLASGSSPSRRVRTVLCYAPRHM